MNEQGFEFDRAGYIVIPQMIDAAQVASLVEAVDRLEEHAVENAHIRRARPPCGDRTTTPTLTWAITCRASVLRATRSSSRTSGTPTLVRVARSSADDGVCPCRGDVFFRSTTRDPHTLQGQCGGHHGGNRNGENHKYRYRFTNERIDCVMVRMVYFIHDNDHEGGNPTVIPGTHKSNLSSPYGNDSDTEPNTISLEVKAGDAIFFSEALRHGGRTNRSDTWCARRFTSDTGHCWQMSQNMATMDEPQHNTESIIAAAISRNRSGIAASLAARLMAEERDTPRLGLASWILITVSRDRHQGCSSARCRRSVIGGDAFVGLLQMTVPATSPSP